MRERGMFWNWTNFEFKFYLRHNQSLISRFTQESVHKYRSAGEVVYGPCLSFVGTKSILEEANSTITDIQTNKILSE